MLTLHTADYIGKPQNCSYPHTANITDIASLKRAVSRDYVCAEYQNHYRNNENFLGANCLPVDCDNDHSENPAEWVTVEDVKQAFPGIAFAVHYSRSHMKEKNGKPARPKFHILFPIDYVTDATVYADMKKMVNAIFPYFDNKALDAARFFFGTQNPSVEIVEGEMNLSEFLSDDEFDADFANNDSRTQTIPQGSRNATMSRFAGRVLKKYGENETSFDAFMEESKKCDPPLDDAELLAIWNSAKKFYAKVQAQPSYVSPEEYNKDCSLRPSDYSDIGQAIRSETKRIFSVASRHVLFVDTSIGSAYRTLPVSPLFVITEEHGVTVLVVLTYLFSVDEEGDNFIIYAPSAQIFSDGFALIVIPW